MCLSPLPQDTGLKALVLSRVSRLHFFVSLQGVWFLWLLSVYMGLCVHAMYIGVLGFGS